MERDGKREGEQRDGYPNRKRIFVLFRGSFGLSGVKFSTTMYSIKTQGNFAFKTVKTNKGFLGSMNVL